MCNALAFAQTHGSLHFKSDSSRVAIDAEIGSYLFEEVEDWEDEDEEEPAPTKPTPKPAAKGAPAKGTVRQFVMHALFKGLSCMRT